MDHKLRSVNTKFWVDPWSESLTPKDKLLFLYLLTNTHTNMLGVYEVSIKKISFETGLTSLEVSKALEGFERVQKVFYRQNHIILINFIKHQRLNTNMTKSALKEFENLPESLKNELSLDGSEGFGRLSKGLVILRKIEVEIEEEIEKEVEVEIEKEKKLIPTYEEFKSFAVEKSPNVNLTNLKNKYDAWVLNGWKTGKNTKIKSWKSTLLNTLQFLGSSDSKTDRFDTAIGAQKKEFKDGW